MAKNKLLPYLFSTLLILVLLSGCGSVEKGEISFVSPAPDTKLHDAALNEGVQITINSTFADPKVATITTIWGSGSCQLDPGTNTSCGTIPAQVGENSIKADVTKNDGSVVSATTNFYWQPYSVVDEFFGKIATTVGGESATPSMAYGIIALIILVIGALLFLNTGKFGVLAAFFLPLIGLAVFSQQTGSVIVTMEILRFFGSVVFGVIVLLLVRNYQNKSHFFRVKRSDGSSLTYHGPGGPSGAQVMDSIGRHGGRLLDTPVTPVPQYNPGPYFPPQGQTSYLGSGGADVYDADAEQYDASPAQTGIVRSIFNMFRLR